MGLLACWTSPRTANCGTVCLAGALSRDHRVFLIHLPVGVVERSWAFHSSRRTWSTARCASRITWKGSNAISAWGIASRMAFS
jgi:hypothetical protein